jgi:hypothetical protein
MLERALTTECCSDIIHLLVKQRHWTISRIARAIHASSDYVRRVQAGKQSFQMPEVEALAQACGQAPHMLIVDSIRREQLPPGTRGLYDLTLQEIERHDEFHNALQTKAMKKRRARTTAA